MLEIGVEKNGQNYVASLIHLPTNILSKNSSQSEEKAIALCVSSIEESVKPLNWLCTKDNGSNIEEIYLNGIMSLRVTGLTITVLDEILEASLNEPTSWHRFTKDNQLYSSCTWGVKGNLASLIEIILSIQGAEYENC